jgi:hypothetical protein
VIPFEPIAFQPKLRRLDQPWIVFAKIPGKQGMVICPWFFGYLPFPVFVEKVH